MTVQLMFVKSMNQIPWRHITFKSSREFSNWRIYKYPFEQQYANSNHKTFQSLYDAYAAKVYGFISKNSNTKEKAEELLIKVFLNVWDNIKMFGEDDEKKISKIVLVVCKHLFKQKNSIT